MGQITCISPVDGSLYAERTTLNISAAKIAVGEAKSVQRLWAEMTLAERIAIVLKVVAIIGNQNDEIVQELAWQMGRPVRYGGEFSGFSERAEKMVELAGEGLQSVVVEESNQFSRRIEREPHGVVLVIAPWNYPYMTAINTVAPALIAGNSVMLKHASQTLLVG